MGLSEARVGATIAVSDVERAKDFYEGKLGLAGGENTGDGGRSYPCAEGTELHIFPASGAGKSESTTAAWEVDDVEATVDELSGNGVKFEQYDEPLKTNAKGIAETDEGGAAWLKDPDGNVLAIVGRS